MPSYSQATISGHLVRDPSVKEVGDTAVTEFTVAVNDKYKDREDVMFLDCKMWGNRGTAFAQYHSKGDAVLVGGKLKQEKWETQGGEKRSKIILNAFEFTFIKAKDTDPSSATTSPQVKMEYAGNNAPIDHSDIPF